MPDINTINGLVLCDETNVNGVTIANITNIDGITKSCCVANGPITLTRSESSCAVACEAEECFEYYTDGNIATCPLVDGDHLWNNSACNCAPAGWYSPKNCEEDCDYCYTVDESCVITVTECEPGPAAGCNALPMAYNAEACDEICAGGECTTYYVNNTLACPLTAGFATAIYTDNQCTECAPAGFYTPKPCDGCSWCYKVYNAGGICLVLQVNKCR